MQEPVGRVPVILQVTFGSLASLKAMVPSLELDCTASLELDGIASLELSVLLPISLELGAASDDAGSAISDELTAALDSGTCGAVELSLSPPQPAQKNAVEENNRYFQCLRIFMVPPNNKCCFFQNYLFSNSVNKEIFFDCGQFVHGDNKKTPGISELNPKSWTV